jgi:hypothetical protein
MSSERFWILVLAVTTFSVGLASGLLLSSRASTPEPGPFGSFEQRMTETFHLEPERVRNLRYVLQNYQAEIDALKERNIAVLDDELVRIGLRHRDLIRTWVIPERHRQEYDLWIGGLPAATLQ